MDPLDPCAPPDLRYLRRLTDAFGIIQHTERERPRLEFGYSLDDVARALIVVVETYRLFPEAVAPEGRGDPRPLHALADVYLQFIEYCQRPDGRFHNFVARDRSFQDDAGSLDSYGRAMWGLGVLLRGAGAMPEDKPRQERARSIFWRALPNMLVMPYLRSKAFTLLGLLAALTDDDSLGVRAHAEHLVRDLVHAYEDAATDDWLWFEDTLRYSNGALCFALLRAAEHPGLRSAPDSPQTRARTAGLRSLDFLLRVLPIDGIPAPIGNKGWYPKGGPRAVYDQQAVDAAAIIVACAVAFTVTKEEPYRTAAETWWSWFFGNNTRQQPLYRPEDGAVYDGLMEEGINEDRGAESVLAFLLAHLALADACCGKRAA